MRRIHVYVVNELSLLLSLVQLKNTAIVIFYDTFYSNFTVKVLPEAVILKALHSM